MQTVLNQSRVAIKLVSRLYYLKGGDQLYYTFP